jgi:site-specific DNA-methyltransferase (adenine-specific)
MKPTPYYDHDGITIYHGDCKEIIHQIDGFDCVLTDPPYCSGGFNEAGKQAAKGMGLRNETIRELGWFVNDNMTTSGICFLLSSVSGWCARRMPPGSTFTAFTDWRMIPSLVPAIESGGMRYQSLIVWVKPNAGLGTGFKAQHELAMHFSNGTPIYYALDGANVINCKRIHSNEREHQTQKPIGLLSEIIRVTSQSGQTVLDPFMGSGSTLVAAKHLGRRAIGIELDEKYCRIAVERLAQTNLFNQLKND